MADLGRKVFLLTQVPLAAFSVSMRLVRPIAIIFIALFAICCVSHRCPMVPYSDALRALRDNASMRTGVVAIKAEARVDQRGKKGRVRGVVLMFAERPNRVRLDAMTQFGPVAILTADGGRFAFTDLRQNRYLEGETCPLNISRLLGVSLSSEQTTAFLLGETVPIEATESAIRCTSEGNYAVSLRGANGSRQQIELAIADADFEKPPGQQHLHLIKSELFSSDGKPILRVTYGDYRPVSSLNKKIVMPFSVRVEQPAFHSDTLVSFRQITLNPSIPPAVFSQKPPPGISKETVPCN
jgi:hypothetical protein